MKRFLYVLFYSLLPFFAAAQPVITHRIIYIGDAGENNKFQGGVIGDAQSKILTGKTTVIYLGDNIYPTGMGLPGSREEKATEQILQHQYKPMREKGAPVYFIPGNHDWDRMGPRGLAKIKRQWQYISEQKDSLLKVVPENGCPEPYEIKINDKFVVIAFDSEWWVHIFSKANPEADCDCNTEDEIIARFKELLAKNRDKVIMLADHHPFYTYGHHGGYYNLVDYFFPLTSVNRKLYIPLPVIGAIYPFVRGTFSVAEDKGHPLYKTMIERINGVFKGFPNMLNVSGHEHGIQFIKDDEHMQVVSGAGAKEAFVKKGKNALYAKTLPGYVTADLMSDKSIKLTYYATEDTVFKQVFTYTKTYSPVKPVPVITKAPITADSILVSARPNLDKVSKWHRKLYGENYRKEWAAKVKLPVIRISEFKGGLTPEKIGGNHQARSLRLTDNSGKEWLLSSIEKYPVIDLPESRRETFAKSWLYDAISGKHPYSSLIAPELAKAVKVAHTKPVIGYVSPDRKLGIYEAEFAGTVCVLEESKGAGATDNTGLMMRQLNADNNNRVDTLEFFRARLLDWFMGDWDQQQDQWKWANKTRDGNKYYNAVPRDRDQAFFINQGLVPKAAAAKWMAPYLEGYKANKNNISDFFVNGRELDARFLSGLDYVKWMQAAQDFKDALTDRVLEKALLAMPEAAYKIRHQEMFKLMQRRRDQLVKAADVYYKFFNRVVDVKATDGDELITVTDTGASDVNVSIFKRHPKGGKGYPVFSKTFDHSITHEVRIYASQGKDSIYINDGKTPIKVRLIGGKGQKTYYAASSTHHTKVYDKQSNSAFSGAGSGIISKHFSDDTTTVSYIPVNPYNKTIPLISMGYNFDYGVWLDAGFKRVTNGFRKEPGSTQEFGAMHTFGSNAWRFRYNGTWFRAIDKADLEIKSRIYTPNAINFFGIGNETRFSNGIDYYRIRFDLAEVSAALRWHNQDSSVSVRVGPTFQYYRYVNDPKDKLTDNPLAVHSFDSTTISKQKFNGGLTAWYILDKRNNRNLPDWGVYLSLKLQGMAGLNTWSRSYVQFTPEVQLFKSVTNNSSFVISEKLGGGVTLGQTAFYQSMFLGGATTLPGFRENRFAGRQMFYNLVEARVKLNTFVPYILPGQFGFTGGYGIGRVWDNRTPSRLWHNTGLLGAYFAPADMVLLNISTGYTGDGFYPYITLKLNL
ncbi:metallophosphoesterase [Mucilaginibacter sp. RS28]|uniref:Metallophosphoesterase n=1 Tax=Mucilaginibacter straminoryzae TaxID=2932774 RepID=A0A9X1X4L5_9SPHI|nr:BamA/TamA family outer membrane protein [Mucilaginibacter straminoryzae]MCJ8208519.1 metallophosphoesterase [Mucilaginibacter straminoryzae]